MYHSSNLPFPFSSCLSSRNANHHNISSPTSREGQPARQAYHHQEAHLQKKSLIQEEVSIQKEANLYVEITKTSQETTKNNTQNPDPAFEAKENQRSSYRDQSTCSCNNASQMPVLILALCLLKGM
ncbi:MAG: hypothetical protein ACK5I7_09210 [Anaerotignum sp.]